MQRVCEHVSCHLAADLRRARVQVWGMHVAGENDSTVATGGADASVVVWQDVTAEEAAKAAAQTVVGVQQQQQLSNALQVRACHGSWVTRLPRQLGLQSRHAQLDMSSRLC